MSNNTLIRVCHYRTFTLFRLCMLLQTNKIWDNIYLPIYIEQPKRITLQTFRYCSYSIRFVNTKRYRFFVIGVTTHQSNICTVKRSYHRKFNPLPLQHLFCHIASICVRNSIMYVQYIYVISFYYIYHFRRERQLIGLIMKQRIFLYVYLVKVNIHLQKIQPHRITISNKMYLMPFAS